MAPAHEVATKLLSRFAAFKVMFGVATTPEAWLAALKCYVVQYIPPPKLDATEAATRLRDDGPRLTASQAPRTGHRPPLGRLPLLQQARCRGPLWRPWTLGRGQRFDQPHAVTSRRHRCLYDSCTCQLTAWPSHSIIVCSQCGACSACSRTKFYASRSMA